MTGAGAEKEGVFVSNQTQTKLPVYLKGSYSFADVTFSLMVTLSNTYAQFFLTDIAFFPTTIVASILFFGRILDAFSVPVTGGIIDRSNLKWGKFRPWLVVGSVLTLVFNVLLFINWNGATGPVVAKAVTACLVYALFCASTNLVYTAFTSLNSALTMDPRERVNLSTLRNMGGSIGKILAGYLLLPMVYFFGNSDQQTARGYFLTAVVTSVILVVGYVNLAFSVGKRDAVSPAAPGGPKPKPISGKESLRLILTNRPLLCLFGADVVRLLAYLVTLAIFPYFFTYVAKDVNAAPMLFGTTSIAMLVGALLIPLLTRFLSKRGVYMTGLVMLGLSFVVAALFKETTLIMVGALVVGFVGYSFGATVTTAMYTDVVDYGEVKYGVNARAIYFSMYQLSIKVAAICSTGIAGFGMALIGYDSKVEPTAKVIEGINFICLALPIGLAVLALLLMLLYNLSDKKMEEVRGTLAAKRGS